MLYLVPSVSLTHSRTPFLESPFLLPLVLGDLKGSGHGTQGLHPLRKLTNSHNFIYHFYNIDLQYLYPLLNCSSILSLVASSPTIFMARSWGINLDYSSSPLCCVQSLAKCFGHPWKHLSSLSAHHQSLVFSPHKGKRWWMFSSQV